MVNQRHSLLLVTALMFSFLSNCPARSDVILEKNLLRRFEINWCPFFRQLEIYFVATAPDAILKIRNTGPDQGYTGEAQIDNIAVVDEDNFIGSFRSGEYSYNYEFNCYGEPFFNNLSSSGVIFEDDFADSNLANWSVDNAIWVAPPSAPTSHSDPPQNNYCNEFYSKMSATTGYLKMGVPQSTASVRLHNLQIGKKYFVTGWLHGGIGEATIAVETTEPLSKKSESFTADNGSGNVDLMFQGAAWTATSYSDWISINSIASTSTGGTVSYSVTANNGPRRVGTIMIAGNVFTVFQGAKFVDVLPSNPFYTEIGKLSAHGITTGCSETNFCPEDLVTQEQMAAFIIRALGLTNPPIPPKQTFSDVSPTRFGFPFIEEMNKRSISQECGPNLYCPDSFVTRDQMAILIIRSLGIFNPPNPSQQRFVDVPPSRTSYPFVEEMAKRMITLGCSPGHYCPDQPVTRGQMAAFLVRAFGL